MTSDRYLPRAPSLRPVPKRRKGFEYPEGFNPAGTVMASPVLAERGGIRVLPQGAGVQSRVPPLPLADLPAPPARGPWEPKED